MVILFVQNNKQERKTHRESRNIDENDMLQWLDETFDIFRQLAAERCRKVFVYDVIGKMTWLNVRHFPPATGRMTPRNIYLWRGREPGDNNKRWRQRRFEPIQETDVKKMINDIVSSKLISLWLASVYGAASTSIQICISPLVLCLQKV